ncbi:hypothetical protein IEO21_08934 [Rhodonia placenta]|nr:hypothetical protein IEO21_11168 [Postia placenta]KAF9798004.1 hypothetical protein IEO21_10807 [Postia placenta]KAF9798626.1 hypothetical protein IEO21_10694 [Postia placenta]KAF9805698.1 hypothetical protein IEO21_08934 [Postia placenta]
MVSSAQT